MGPVAKPLFLYLEALASFKRPGATAEELEQKIWELDELFFPEEDPISHLEMQTFIERRVRAGGAQHVTDERFVLSDQYRCISIQMHRNPDVRTLFERCGYESPLYMVH